MQLLQKQNEIHNLWWRQCNAGHLRCNLKNTQLKQSALSRCPVMSSCHKINNLWQVNTALSQTANWPYCESNVIKLYNTLLCATPAEHWKLVWSLIAARNSSTIIAPTASALSPSVSLELASLIWRSHNAALDGRSDKRATEKLNEKFLHNTARQLNNQETSKKPYETTCIILLFSVLIKHMGSSYLVSQLMLKQNYIVTSMSQKRFTRCKRFRATSQLVSHWLQVSSHLTEV